MVKADPANYEVSRPMTERSKFSLQQMQPTRTMVSSLRLIRTMRSSEVVIIVLLRSVISVARANDRT